MQRYFKIRFSIVIALMLLLGASSVFFLYSVYSSTKFMYEHPYRVSNELKLIRISIDQLHLLRKGDVVQDRFIIGKHDTTNQERLTVISERYLGDELDVINLKAIYGSWVVLLLEDSSPMERKDKFRRLNAAIAILSEFADNKAAEFYTKAKSDTTTYALIIGIGLLFATAISLYLLIYTLRTLKAISLNRKQHSQIIDQNVMISAVDDEGNIFDISNRLSRFLGKDKQDVLSLHCKEIFFESDQDLFNDMWQEVNSGSTWHGEIAIHNDDVITWLGIDVLPMQTNNYTYSGFRLLAHDITSRKSLEQISLTDALTGLLNRRSLDLVLERQIKLAVRSKQALTAVMLDVDFFKLYNDTYGHPAGDKVLTRLATVLTRMLARPDDFVFRIGGEEFLLVFNSNSPDDSEQYVEKIRQAVQSLNIKHEASKVAKDVTVSMGAVFFGGASVIESSHLLSDADDNLYQAKVARNSFVQSEI